VLPKAKDDLVSIRNGTEAESTVTAQLQAGVLGTVKKCTGSWCRISGDGFDGWIQQERLWGVYPNEKVE
jgi:SH3-like domain-containing protein